MEELLRSDPAGLCFQSTMCLACRCVACSVQDECAQAVPEERAEQLRHQHEGHGGRAAGARHPRRQAHRAGQPGLVEVWVVLLVLVRAARHADARAHQKPRAGAALSVRVGLAARHAAARRRRRAHSLHRRHQTGRVFFFFSLLFSSHLLFSCYCCSYRCFML